MEWISFLDVTQDVIPVRILSKTSKFKLIRHANFQLLSIRTHNRHSWCILCSTNRPSPENQWQIRIHRRKQTRNRVGWSTGLHERFLVRLPIVLYVVLSIHALSKAHARTFMFRICLWLSLCSVRRGYCSPCHVYDDPNKFFRI